MSCPVTFRFPWLPLSVMPLLPMVACADGSDPAGSAVTIIDSAGVSVVHNPSRGLWGPGEGWTVEEVVRVGGADTGPELEFGQIVGVDTGPDGEVYVADMQARRVHVFGSDGSHLRSFGQGGSGPGELGMAIMGPFVSDGEVRIVDLQNQRVSRFSPTGEPLGSSRLDFAAGVPIRWDETGDGRLVAQFRTMTFTDTASREPTGDPVVALGSGGEVEDTLTVLPAGESMQIRGGNVQMRLFEPEPMWDVGPDGRIVTGRNHEFRFLVWGPEGELARVVTFPGERRRVTERDQEVILDAMHELLEQQGAPPQAVEMMMSRMEFAEHYPAFASLLAGPGGAIWTQRVRSGEELADAEGSFDPQDMGSNEWDVFDADGRYLGVVAFPARFQPLRVEGDRFWGVGRDELDVQSLVAYRLMR